jgi:hypothetical protein
VNDDFEVTQALIKRAVERAPTIRRLPATVTAFNQADWTATVTTDEPEAQPVTATNLTGWYLRPGMRVAVDFVPPAGAQVVGIVGPAPVNNRAVGFVIPTTTHNVVAADGITGWPGGSETIDLTLDKWSGTSSIEVTAHVSGFLAGAGSDVTFYVEVDGVSWATVVKAHINSTGEHEFMSGHVLLANNLDAGPHTFGLRAAVANGATTLTNDTGDTASLVVAEIL